MLTPKPILIVDDSPDDRLLIVRSLKKHNFANEILMAEDGARALDMLFGEGSCAGRPPVTPAVILLDIKMPKVTGLEVLRRVRDDERTRHQAVVILTSSDEERDVIESYSLGVNSFVQKPVDFAAFSEAVSMLGIYWLALNEAPPTEQKAS